MSAWQSLHSRYGAAVAKSKHTTSEACTASTMTWTSHGTPFLPGMATTSSVGVSIEKAPHHSKPPPSLRRRMSGDAPLVVARWLRWLVSLGMASWSSRLSAGVSRQ